MPRLVAALDADVLVPILSWTSGVRHAEIFFDPQTHTDRDIARNSLQDALLDSTRRAELLAELDAVGSTRWPDV